MSVKGLFSKRTRKWISVALLCFVNLINYMDRYTVSGVLNEIINEWELEHWEGGLIQTAFVICYFASAPVFGFLGDRYSRKWLMIVGVFAWGSCTLISSFMPTYLGFLLLRASIGFGEAGFTSIAPTVLGDLFNDSSRTIVLALFYFAIPVGSGLGYVVGSKVASAAEDWHWGVRVTPLLNLVALILMLIFMLDPPRGEHEQKSAKHSRSWGNDVLYLLKNKSYMLSTIAFTCLTFCTGALSWWGPYFMEDGLKVRQQYNLEGSNSDPSTDDVAFLFGLVLSVAGITGLTLGSGLSYWLRKKIAWVDPVICGAGLLISTPFLYAALATIQDSVSRAFGLMFIGQVFLNMNWAVVVDISLYVVMPIRRSSAEAFQLMASHALGEAGSPYLTGLISDKLKSNLEGEISPYNSTVVMTDTERSFFAMQNALFITLAFEILGAFFFLATALFVVKDRKRAEEEELAGI